MSDRHTEKINLRQRFSQIRGKVSKPYREQSAVAAAKLLEKQTLFINSRCIACYLPFRNEFDSWRIIELIWKANKTCYLPVLQDDKSLHFVKYEKNDTLIQNRYGIFEPSDISRVLPLEKLDMVIAPLVAFDGVGHRLGTGGGYYDRSFANINRKKVKMIGLAYQAQQADIIPSEPWDIQLDGVITEKQFIIFQ